MYEPLLPIDELKNLRFAVSALAETGTGTNGSFKLETARNAARGIETRLDWVIRQLEAAGEGKKNSGA